MIKVTIQRNQKGLAELRKRIARVNTNTPHVKVGLLSNGKPRSDDSDLSNAEIGAVHEFGAEDAGIPARPWLRPTMKKHAEEYRTLIGQALQDEIRGVSSLNKTLGRVGAKAAADVKKYITAGDPIPPPNAPSTLKRKASKTRKGATIAPRTLVDSGQMVAGITYKVEFGTNPRKDQP